ncbi:hypothetical protein SynMITS9220_02415 [Synechococcus sp. MIT S9220]|nr:hypothetical protein SynMITS9220_02415 [Synechococcus sp. MIT S9220]
MHAVLVVFSFVRSDTVMHPLGMRSRGAPVGYLSPSDKQKERSSSRATAISISCLGSSHHPGSGNKPRAQTPRTRLETQSLSDRQCVKPVNPSNYECP